MRRVGSGPGKPRIQDPEMPHQQLDVVFFFLKPRMYKVCCRRGFRATGRGSFTGRPTSAALSLCHEPGGSCDGASAERGSGGGFIRFSHALR